MRTMYDSVTASALPTNAAMVACYINGPYANEAAVRARCPHATVVRISVRAGTNDGHVCDCEAGDLTPAQAVAWVVMRRKAGADPTVYCSASAWPTVQAAFRNAGVAQPHYWIAHYDGSTTIPAGAVAKQYQDPPKSGGNYDISAVADHWPGVDEGGDVPLTDADAGTVWDFKNPTLDKIDMRQRLVNAETNSAAAVAALKTLAAQVDALTRAVAALQAGQTPTGSYPVSGTITIGQSAVG